jgi:hypothetical protein
MDFMVNMLLRWKDDPSHIERILWMDSVDGRIVTIDILDKKAWPIVQDRAFLVQCLANDEISVLLEDSYQYLRQPDEQFSPARLQRRDDAWETIKTIIQPDDEMTHDEYGAIFCSHILGPRVRSAAEKTGHTKSAIYAYLRLYWQRGQMKNALLPSFDRRGSKGKPRQIHGPKRGRPNKRTILTGVTVGMNIDEKSREYFQRGIRLFYETSEKRTLQEAFERTLALFFHQGKEWRNGILVPILPPAEELPTVEQFRYWYEKERDLKRSLIARDGEHTYRLRRRAKLGSLRHGVPGPGFIYEIDATVADIYLVSALHRRHIIGRPVIYIIIDVFSSLIVGMSVSLEGPSWLGAMLALENMALDKVAFCKEYGFDITEDDWPCHHLPKEIRGDRGELLSKHADNLANALHIRVTNTAPYRPDWKGFVERSFRTLNDMAIHWEPGSVKNLPEPGRKDHRLDACLTLHDFRRLLISCILEHNKGQRINDDHFDRAMIEDEVEPYPCEVWKWGIQNRTGILQEVSRQVLRLNLLPQATASVTREGIRFHNLRYTCERAEREQWFEQVRTGKRSWHIPIVYDPRTSDSIYLRDPDGKDLEICTLLEKDRAKFSSCDWFDLEDYFVERSLKIQTAETNARQIRVEGRAQRDHDVEEAVRLTEEAKEQGETKADHLRNIHEHHKAERKKEQEENVWFQKEQAASPSPRKEIPKTTKTKRIALLQKMQQGGSELG